jgi:DNA mismatch repair protein MSH5
MCRPQLVRENVIDIVNGRHLLHEVSSDRPVIPNDTHVPEAKGRVTVVTGPTMSGKSVYLKSIALITYLAHVGSFVPADSARVGLTDRIFTRIISHDSLVSRVGQSSFMRDLNQVSLMVNNATERSLCIVDEFGKGTKTSDGVGLLDGFLRSMSGMNTPPKVFVATHYTAGLYKLNPPDGSKARFQPLKQLKYDFLDSKFAFKCNLYPHNADVTDSAFVPRNANMQYVTMSVHTAGAAAGAGAAANNTENNGDGSGGNAASAAGQRPRQQRRLDDQSQPDGDGGDEEVTFLYRVVPGVSTRAYSLRCAREAGLPQVGWVGLLTTECLLKALCAA